MSLITTTSAMVAAMDDRERLIAEKKLMDRSLWESEIQVRDLERMMAEGKMTAEWTVRTAVNDEGKPRYKNEKERELAIQQYLIADEIHQKNQTSLDLAKEGKWKAARSLYQVKDELRDKRDDIYTGSIWVAALATGVGQEILSGKRNADPAKW